MNENGQQEFGEMGLADAIVTLDSALSVTTTGNGLITGTFSFPVTTTGIHYLNEKNPPGFRSTTPDNLGIDIIYLTDTYHAEFGDVVDRTPAKHWILWR